MYYVLNIESNKVVVPHLFMMCIINSSLLLTSSHLTLSYVYNLHSLTCKTETSYIQTLQEDAVEENKLENHICQCKPTLFAQILGVVMNYFTLQYYT